MNSEAPLHPVNTTNNQLFAYGIDLIDCGDTFSYNNLKFPTSKEAADASSILESHQKACTPYQRNDFKRLHWAVDSLKILDKAYTNKNIEKTNETPNATKNIKTSFIQRLKNAWQALKEN